MGRVARCVARPALGFHFSPRIPQCNISSAPLPPGKERLKMHKQVAAAFILVHILFATSASFALPAPDHIVIVIDENETPSAILGSANAPFINSLAAGGASFANFYSVTHPSQPNYLHMYSGASQEIFDDSALSATFSTPNLGAELLAAGKSFAGDFEDLPAAGSTIANTGEYSRRHNPIMEWQSNNT